MRSVVYWSLFVASFKMFIRNRAALFFSLFVPLVIMVIFGVLNFGGGTSVDAGRRDEAHDSGSAQLATALQQTDTFELHPGARDAELAPAQGGASRPGAGDSGRVPARPSDLRCGGPGGVQQPPKPEQAQVGALILNALVGQLLAGGRRPGAPLVRSRRCRVASLGYIDFLVPGVLGLTIMHLGLFAVAFGFVQLKRTGTLRRLFATPTPPGYFLAAQVA